MSTPTHHPTYGVNMSQKTIQKIIDTFPGVKLQATKQVESGRSYNNRIYFLTVTQDQPSSLFGSTHIHECELVLKVNGRFFGADKVQNEVACLRLLHQYCPSVATPRAIAWSENGPDMKIAYPLDTEPQTATLDINSDDESSAHGGWILMSRVPGESVSRFDLDTQSMEKVMIQLADIMALIKTQIPAQRHVGNLQHKASKSEAELTIGQGRNELNLSIRGVLFDGIKITQPINEMSQYHKIKVEEKMKEIQSKEAFAPNKHLLPKLESFLNETLPHLSSSKSNSDTARYVFTHYDISPRNVLISNSHDITGLVDFEFSGFFDEIDEFLNDYAANIEDWGETTYQVYLGRLAENGIKTPINGLDPKRWDQARCLDRLLENIAPWWLPGDKEGKELELELQKASDIVTESLNKLSSQ